MKFNKKFLGAIVATSVIFGTSITAFASTSDDVISALRSDGASSAQVTQAQSYLNNNKSITSSQLSDVVSQINILSNAGVKNITDYKKLQSTNPVLAAKVYASAKQIASDTSSKVVIASNGSVSIEGSNGNTLLSLNGANQTASISNSSAITGAAGNTTFTNYGNLLALGAVIAITGATGLTISKKKVVLTNNH